MIAADQLARRYDQAVAAYWRGDPDPLQAIETWLATCWSADRPPPVGSPVAVNVHAAGGHGLRWYEQAGGLLGAVPGGSGCYRVPSDAILPPDAVDRDDSNHAGGRPASAADHAAAEETMPAPPLDDLANVVLEEFGDAARSAVARLVERERRRHEPTGRVPGHAYDLREIARQPLQPGCWVTVGEVTSTQRVTLVEVNVASGTIREVEASLA